MKVIIIDDEPLAVALVQEYLQSHTAIEVVAICHNGFDGLKAIIAHTPDLIFLDVQMPKVTGFELLELLENPPAVIFTTAFDQFALKAFEAHAVDYLLKPFSKERFDAAVDKFMQQQYRTTAKSNTSQLLQTTTIAQPEEQNRVVVKSGNSICIIPVPTIRYIEAYDDYTKIYTEEGCFLKKKTMQFFDQTLPAAQFVRVHRSYIIQLNHLTRIEPMGKEQYIALLQSGDKIPLSKTGYARLKEVLSW